MTRDDTRHSIFMLGLVLAAILSVRLMSLWFNNSELFFDEAQYWFWSRDLEFGYFSKPPLLAWVISATTDVCGSNSEFCVRLAAPLLNIGTAYFIYLSAARLFGQKTGFWAAILFSTLPAVSLSSTIISTDVPLLFMWSVAIYLYVRLWQENSVFWAIMLGVVIGLGLNAKYAMAYFIGCSLLHALVEQQNVTPPRSKVYWLSVLVAAGFLVPNLLWNLDNGFVTVSHTGENIGWSGLDLNWTGFAEFFGSQFGVFGPILFGLYLATIFRMFGDSISREHRFLVSFSLPVLVLILFQALMSKAYANWAATAYVAACILVAEVLVNRVHWGWMRATLSLHIVTFIVLAIAVCYAGAGQIVLPNGIQPFHRTQGASLIAEEVEAQLDAEEYNALVTTDRTLSALMNYNLRHRPEAILAWKGNDTPRNHFELVSSLQESPRDPALVVSRHNNADRFSGVYKNVISLGSRDIAAGKIKKIYFFKLEGHASFQ